MIGPFESTIPPDMQSFSTVGVCRLPHDEGSWDSLHRESVAHVSRCEFHTMGGERDPGMGLRLTYWEHECRDGLDATP